MTSPMVPLGLHYWHIAWSRWRLILACVALGTLAAWAYSTFVLAQDPKFEAAARLNVVPTSEELGYASRFVRGSTFDGGSVLLGTYAEVAHTRPVVAPIVDRFIAEMAQASGQTPAEWLRANTSPPGFSPGRIVAILNYGEAPPLPLREQIIEELIKNTVIETIEGTYLIRLSVTWDDPVQAAWFANALAEAVVARAEKASKSSGQQIAGSLERRLDQKQAELAAVLRQSRDAKSALGVVDIDQQKQALLEARVAEQAQLTSDRAALQQSQAQVASLKKQTGGRLNSAQQVLEQTLAVEAPRATGLAKGIDVRQGRIGQLDSQIAALGRNEIAIKQIDDRARQLQAEVNALTERVSFSQTENTVNGPRIELIERAQPPVTRSSPKIFFNTILGFIAGAALAVCLLLLIGGAPERTVEPVEEADEDNAGEDASPKQPATSAPEPPTVVAPPPTPRPDDHVVRPIRTTPPIPTEARTIGAPTPSPAPSPKRELAMAAVAAAPAVLRAEELIADPQPTAQPDPVTKPAFKAETARVAPPQKPVPAAKPRPRSEEKIEDPCLFPGVLPRPATGEWSNDERTQWSRRLSHWLMEPLADDRPLLIGAATDDEDARLVATLLLDHLRAAGLRAQLIDATAGPIHVETGRGKPVLIAGALDTPHRRATMGAFAEPSGGGAIVVAVPITPDQGLAETLSQHARSYRAIARRAVHVVAIGA